MQSCESSQLKDRLEPGQDSGTPLDGAEIELWWGGYAGRTMWPSFVLAGLLAVTVIAVAWYGWAVQGFDRLTMRYGAYAIIGCLAIVQFGRWARRIIMWNYRLTTRNLYIERSFVNKRHPAYPLAQVRDVVVVQQATDRMVNVGLVRLMLHDRAPINLPGVHEPANAASLIMNAALQARNGRPEVPLLTGDGAPKAAHHEGAV